MLGSSHRLDDPTPAQIFCTHGCRRADIVLIPTAPTAPDMNRVSATLDLTTDAARPRLLLVKARAGTRAPVAAPDQALRLWLQRYTEFVATKHGLAAARHSGSLGGFGCFARRVVVATLR